MRARMGVMRVAAALLVIVPARIEAQAGDDLEYRVKAAYLLNFTRYVEWPARAFASAGEPINVCVLGSNPFGATLAQTLEGRQSHRRPLAMRQVERLSDARECHVVFMSHAEWRRRPDALAALRSRGVLTVGESAEFAEAGGVLSFVPVEQTVRFAVNLAARDEAGLRISSRMLALASHVYAGSRP